MGDGTTIGIWQDPWLNVKQQQRLMGPPRESDQNVKVADLFIPNSTELDTERIREICPFAEEKILKIKTSRSGAPDKLCWLGTKNGVYSTKSGYHAAFNETNDAENLELAGNWNQEVWNLITAPKVKMLIWKVLRGALPVGTKLEDRHIRVDSRCKRCGSPESIIHLFYQCDYAKAVWQTSPFAREVDSSRTLDLRENWNQVKNKTCLPPSGISSVSWRHG